MKKKKANITVAKTEASSIYLHVDLPYDPIVCKLLCDMFLSIPTEDLFNIILDLKVQSHYSV